MTTLYAATASLDGYIAGPDGDMSWLAPFLADGDPVGDELAAEVGCLLVGGRTHRGDDPNAGTGAEGAFGGAYDGPAVVLTRRGPHGRTDGAEFVADVREAVARATQLAAGRRVSVLGAACARSLLDAALLDEVLVDVVPVLLGRGTRVLDRPDGPTVHLDRLPDRPGHWYAVRR